MQRNGRSSTAGNGATATRPSLPRPEEIVAAPDETPVFVGTRPVVTHPKGKVRRDYRLRGVDLDAPVFVDAATRGTPRRHRRRRHRRLALWWLAVAAVAAAVAVAVRATALTPYTVPTNAMAPTLQAGDRIVAVTSSLLHGPIGRGTLVVFHQQAVAGCSAGTAAGQDLVQRVIGLPGDTVSSDGSTVLVNGSPLHEAGWYNTSEGPVGKTPIPLVTVPDGSYLVLNDNRADACDSRAFGTISRSQVVGTVFMVVTRHGHPSFQVF